MARHLLAHHEEVRLSTRGLIENHLVPYYGSKDLRTLREADLLAFVGRKLDQGLERLYPAPGLGDDISESHNYLKTLAPPGGLEPPTLLGTPLLVADRS